MTIREQFDRYIDLWMRDEALGYDGIFFSEHHFGPGYSPAPNLLVATMAPRTQRMRLGSLGASVAHVSPLRIVEEFAMLDHLTEGRLEIGVVRGAPPELIQLGVTIEQAEARFDATLRAVDAAFRTPADAFACGTFEVAPAMRQASPPRWLAITSEGSARRAASLGWKACSGFISVSTLKAHFDAYRETSGLGWREAAENLGVRRMVRFVSDRSAIQPTKAAIRAATVEVLKQGAPKPDPSARPPEGGASHGIVDLDAFVARMLSDDEFIVGTPVDVAEEIIHQCRTAGCAHFLALLNSSEIFAEVSDMHRIYGEQVIPLLRKADLAPIGSAA